MPFSLESVSVLWDLEEFDTEELILRLDDAALLDFDLKMGGIYIHRVLRSYLESQLVNIKDLQSKLTERWLRTPYDLPDTYACMWIGWHLIQAGESERLRQLLLDYNWLESRLKVIPIQAVLQDFDLLGELQDARVVRDALRLAAHGLSFDPNQLRAQLRGRIDRGRFSAVDTLLDKSDESESRPRLTLAGTSLTHPGGALTSIVKSHAGAIDALAVSADGRWFISGSQDWTLRLWDLRLGAVVRTLEGHAGVVHSVIFSADGKSIISGSEDRTLRLWEVATGKEKQLFRGHTLAVQGVAISGDGKVISSVSEDGTVRIWNINNKQSKIVYKGRDHQLNTVVITVDGSELYFGAGDWTIRRLDLQDGTLKSFEGHSGIVRSLALTSDECRLLSGADDGTMRVWSLTTGESLLILKGHTASVEAVAVTQDGRKAISGSRDKTIRVWDLQIGGELEVLEGHSGFVKSIAISSVSDQIISGSTDRTIRFWDMESAPDNQSRSGHKEAVALLTISADGSKVISGTQSGELILWETHAYEDDDDDVEFDESKIAPRVSGYLRGHTDRIHTLQMTADGEQAITGSRDRTLRLWDITRKVCKQVLTGHGREVLDSVISADGRRIVSISRDRTVRVWSAETGHFIRAMVSKDNERMLSSLQVDDAMLAELDIGPAVDIALKPIPPDPSIALSPDGNLMVIGSQGNVRTWDLNTGLIKDQELGDLDIVAIAFDPNSEKIVLGSLFGPLLVWAIDEEPRFLDGHTGRVLDIVVTADGKYLISAAKDDTIRVWDLDCCKQIGQLTNQLGKVDAVAIAPNSHWVYSVYGDTLVVYDIDISARIASLSFDHQITTIAVTPSGKQIAIGDQSGQMHYLCLQT